jgi:hypothetical protein
MSTELDEDQGAPATASVGVSLRETIRHYQAGSTPAWTAIDFCRNIHLSFYDQVKSADQKASYVFTFLTILFVFTRDPRNMVATVAEGPVLSLKWALSVLFILSAAFALTCAALVVLPRAKAGTSALYWGAWAYDEDREHKVAAHLKDEDIIAEYLGDAKNLARLCAAKYRYVNLAFRGAAVTIACQLILVMLR